MAKKANPFAKKSSKDDCAPKGGKMKGGKKK
jgi:hypothetical protein